MLKNKVIVEIYEGDPFTGCCGPGLVSSRANETMNLLIKRNEIVKALKKEFKDQIEVERVIVSSRRPYSTYPMHVQKLLSAGTRVPFILVGGQLISAGVFPSFEEFKQLVKEHCTSLSPEVSS
jgi:hypothetical protein